MASGPVTSWQIDGETMETERLYFLGSKITAVGDFSQEIKRRLHLGRKVITNLDNILKNRDITLTTKVHLVKAMVFPVVMYGCESWTIKKADCWRILDLELWCWRKLLRVPWTARRSNQSILKEISPEYSLEGVVLKLKLQYFGHLIQESDTTEWLNWTELTQRTDSFEKTLMLGKIEGRRRREWQRMRWLDGISNSMNMSLSMLGDGQGRLVCYSLRCHELDTTEQLNWKDYSFHTSFALFPIFGRETLSFTIEYDVSCNFLKVCVIVFHKFWYFIF